MDTTTYISLSRQTALQRQMTTIATNIANATSAGFQAEHTVFQHHLQRSGQPRRLAYVQDIATVRDTRPGPMTLTGNPLDVALKGEGYLMFQTDQGRAYGRGGHLSPDADGRLVSSRGHPVLDLAGNPILVEPTDKELAVASDGTLSGRDGPIARLAVVTFADEQALERVGGGLYRTGQAPVPVRSPRIAQGMLEGSNAEPVIEMTAMLATVRAFEGVSRMLQTQHELDRQAIERTIRSTG